jgi:hypothetical protein
MMMKQFAIAAMCLMCAGCALPLHHGDSIPLETVVLDNKHALVNYADQVVFEEFVKYKELGSSFNLSMITGTSIEVATSEGVTDTSQASASFPLVLSKGVGVTKTIAVNSGDTGKLTITLSPISNSPKTYRLIKQAFKRARAGIYGTIDGGKNKPAEFSKVCTQETYCFMIPNDDNTYAYLTDIRKFRMLLDDINTIEPPKAPPAAGTPKKT